MPTTTRSRARRAVIVVAGVVTLFGTFAPWLRSGASRRSSYDLLSLVERIGFAPGGVVEWAVRLWPVLPVLVVGAVVTSWWRWLPPWVSVVLGVGAGVYAGSVAVAVRRAPELGPIAVEWGPAVTIVGAIGLVAGGVWSGVAWRRSVEPDATLDEHLA